MENTLQLAMIDSYVVIENAAWIHTIIVGALILQGRIDNGMM